MQLSLPLFPERVLQVIGEEIEGKNFEGIGSLVAGQQVEALGGQPGGQEVYVLLFATFNCLGRMVCGFGSEWLLHRFALPR